MKKQNILAKIISLGSASPLKIHMKNSKISPKIQRLLQIILLVFAIIAFRVWHLGVIQREEKLIEADHPKKRVLVQKANRGIIFDRFGIPLAVNKISYNAAIYYNQITQIPSTGWQEDETGVRIRTYPRKKYIENLSKKLAHILSLDPTRIEDLIHSKASLFPHVPFIIKSGLTEEEHYRLAAIEKEWPGLHSEITSERFYPKGKIGAEVIGYMGSISTKEYTSIAQEIQILQKIIDDYEMGLGFEFPEKYASFEAVTHRLQELKEKAYTIQDLIGKSGIEKEYENELRGFYGKKIYEVDQRGKFLRPRSGGRKAIPGKEITLSLSIELQEFAESLLAQNEAFRDGKSVGFDPECKERKTLKQPWIKGGSIVALDPNTGEVLALASTPRFDPNDFIPTSNPTLQKKKRNNIDHWLENERYIASIWDGKEPLIRERHSPLKGFYEEKKDLTWDLFLEILLPSQGPLKDFFQKVTDVKTAIQVQEDLEFLLFHSQEKEAFSFLEKLYPKTTNHYFQKLQSINLEVDQCLKRFDTYLHPFHSTQDRLFAIDLCRLIVHAPAFTDASIKLLGSMPLPQYRALNQSFSKFEDIHKEIAEQAFHENHFKKWREINQKEFIAQLRKIEKMKKIPNKPYIDFLDQKEKRLFKEYWKEHRLSILAASIENEPNFQFLQTLSIEEKKSILHTFRNYIDLQRPLLKNYPRLRKTGKEQLEKHLAASFYPIGGFGHSRSYAFQSSSPPGSIFKLVTSYAALSQSKGENPLTLIDQLKKRQNGTQILATSPAGFAYPRIYKGGRLPKSHSPEIGKVDLCSALEQSSNPYFSILAGDFLHSPEDLNESASLFGFGKCSGIDLPGEIAGHLPTDLSNNRTGLYSTAIGQHTLLASPLQAAVMLAAIANGGKVLKPHVAKNISGVFPNRQFLHTFEQFQSQDELCQLGICFPLFTALNPRGEILQKKSQEPEILHKISLPQSIRSQLLEGMDRVVWGNKGTARPSSIKSFFLEPAKLIQYLSLSHQMVGKTSTTEIVHNPNINPSSPGRLYKNIWFGAISFKEGSQKTIPELVVVVYLRFGDGGKEAAPLAAQIIDKWRKIKLEHIEILP